jgi:hypothetical protein
MRFCLPIAVWIADGHAFHGKNAASWLAVWTKAFGCRGLRNGGLRSHAWDK